MATGGRIEFKPGIPFFKNRIINGDFAIWQRGTSASYVSIASTAESSGYTSDIGYKTADRVLCSVVHAGGQFTVSKSSFNNIPSFKVTVDTPPADLTWDGSNTRYWQPFRYMFEGQHLYDLAVNGKTATISFLWKSNVAGKISIALKNITGVGGESTYESYVTSFDSLGGDQVQKVEILIPFQSSWITTPVNDENVGFELNIGFIGDVFKCDVGQENQWVNLNANNYCPVCVSDYTNWASTAGNYIEIAQLQLEEGEVATEFEYVPYDVQLMRCMRYYEIIQVIESGYSTSIWHTTVVPFQVEKRAVPSISYTEYSSTNVNSIQWTASTRGQDLDTHRLVINLDPIADGQVSWSGKVFIDAEL